MNRAISLFVLFIALPACTSQVTEQGLVVRVSNPGNVAGIVQLRVYASNQKTPGTLLLPATTDGTPIAFGTSFSLVVPSGRSGQVDVAIVGLDASRNPVASGTGSSPLLAGKFVILRVDLQPGRPLCGDGNLDSEEGCDDGNRYSGDGCNYLCQSEETPDAAPAGPELPEGDDAGSDDTLGAGGTLGTGGTPGTAGVPGSGGTGPTDAPADTAALPPRDGPISADDTRAPITNCGPPEMFIYGDVSYPSTNIGAIATYTCRLGWAMSGSSTRTCLSSGVWSPGVPTCTLVDCKAPAAPTNGSVEALATTYSARATYSCPTDYALVGNQYRYCEADGTWSDTTPTCQCNRTLCNGTCANLQADSNNCGSCGNTCSTTAPSTAQCVSGHCLVTLAAGTNPSGLVLDGTNVYWTDISANTVKKTPLAGGATVTLATSPVRPLGGIAVDKNYVYWTTWDDGGVRRQPLGGGSSETLASGSTGAGAITVDTNNLYWIDGDYNVRKLALGGGDSTTIGSNAWTSALAVDSDHAYWLHKPPTDSKNDGVVKGPIEFDGTSTSLASGNYPLHLALGASDVFWTDQDDRTVMKVSVNGGASTTLASLPSPPTSIAVDNTAAYVSCEDGTVVKIPQNGGTPTTLASTQEIVHAIAVDGTGVYWTSRARLGASGSVTKLSPK